MALPAPRHDGPLQHNSSERVYTSRWREDTWDQAMYTRTRWCRRDRLGPCRVFQSSAWRRSADGDWDFANGLEA